MWKGYREHLLWVGAAKILAAATILAIWIALAWKISEWIATAFKGMFL